MNETTETLSPELEEKRKELAEKRKAYEAKAAENAKESAPERTAEEIAADVEKELKKAAKYAKKNEPKILEAFPLLAIVVRLLSCRILIIQSTARLS